MAIIEVTVYCSKCGSTMKIRPHRLGEVAFPTDPCRICQKQTKDVAYTAGYDRANIHIGIHIGSVQDLVNMAGVAHALLVEQLDLDEEDTEDILGALQVAIRDVKVGLLGA